MTARVPTSLAFWALALPLLTLPIPAVQGHGDVAISAAATLQGSPALVHDPAGDRFLAVWSDFRNRGSTALDIYARFIASDGRPEGGDLAVAVAPEGQAFPAVAFDPVSGRYLVTWTDWRRASTTDSDIFGRFLSADGTPSGPDFAIAVRRGISQKYPVVGFESLHRQFLVVWVDRRQRSQGRLYGRFIGDGGQVSSAEFAVTRGGGAQDGPALACDEARGRFLVVWRDAGSPGIYGTFVHPGEASPGKPIPIAEGKTASPLSPYGIAYAARHDVFLVVWSAAPVFGGGDQDLYGVLLRGADARPLGPVFTVASAAGNQSSAAIAFEAGDNRFLVAWYDSRRVSASDHTDIYARLISPAGDLSPESRISDQSAAGVRGRPGIARGGRGAMVVWEDARKAESRHRRIYGRLIEEIP